MAEFRYIRPGDGWQTVALGPLLKTQSELVLIFLFGRKDFVEQGAFCNDRYSSSETRDLSKDPAKTQWGSEGNPSFTAAYGWIGGGPVHNDGLFVVAELIKNCGMFDENCLERRSMARYLVGHNFQMPLSEELLQLQLKIWGQRPWGPECRSPWSRFSVPLYGGVDGIQGQGAEMLLDVICQATEGIAESEATIIGSQHFGLFESGLGVGPQRVYDGPESQAVLKPFRGQDSTDNAGSELVFSATPQRGQTKLGVRVHCWFFEDAFAWVEELTNEG